MRYGKVAALLGPLVLSSLLAACGSAGASATAAAPNASATPWIMNATGNVTPSPTPSVSYSSPAPFPTGFLPISSAGGYPAPAPTGSDCANVQFHAGMLNSAGVLAGTTSATVTWYNPGGANLVEYRVTAISQNPVVGAQRDIGWTVLKPGTGCGMLSAPVTGLDRQTSYVFSVDAVFTSDGVDGTRATTVARSVPTRTG